MNNKLQQNTEAEIFAITSNQFPWSDQRSGNDQDRSDIRRSLGSNLLRRFAEHIFSLENQIYVLFYR